MNTRIEIKRLLLLTLIIYLAMTLLAASGVLLLLPLHQLQETGTALDENTFNSKFFLAIFAIPLPYFLPFSLFSSVGLEISHLKAYKKLGLVLNSISTTTETEITVPFAPEKAFHLCKESLNRLLHAKTVYGLTYTQQHNIIFSDPKAGILRVKTDFVTEGSRPWLLALFIGQRKKGKGELIEFQLKKQGEADTCISIQSSARTFFGLLDYGQNHINITNLETFFKDELADSKSAAS